MAECVTEKGILFSIYVTEKISKEMRSMLLRFEACKVKRVGESTEAGILEAGSSLAPLLSL